MSPPLRPADLSRRQAEPLLHLETGRLSPLPAPLDLPDRQPPFRPLSAQVREVTSWPLDDTATLRLPAIDTEQQEQALIEAFLTGLQRLFDREQNWTFYQPLLLTVEYCARCQTCSDACHIFEASGRQELYRPTFRSEVLRRLYHHHVRGGPGLLAHWRAGRLDINGPLVLRLAELAYRCNLCRRCAQHCPMGADNGLVAHELRKLFSQEMGIAPRELHQDGSELQLRTGSSTGMSPAVLRDNMAFVDQDITERTGITVETPWDVEGADYLLMHNAGEILAWPENPGAFALVLNAAGVSWTLSSELTGYDAVNYGLWYDDVQLAKVAVHHAEIARRLKVKKILVGECGHAAKALSVVADRVLTGGLNIPRASALELLRDIVLRGGLDLDPTRNDFPVTLHDPCNLVRLMGVVEPQRQILRTLCPEFREMTPHGLDNYCCGGGSGFAIMSPNNFADWRFQVAGRRKLQQVLEAFADCLDPATPKYLCAPCSNCKGQLRDMIAYYDLWENNRVLYGPGFIEWEWR
jgi:Fe-S oxidoreductase